MKDPSKLHNDFEAQRILQNVTLLFKLDVTLSFFPVDNHKQSHLTSRSSKAWLRGTVITGGIDHYARNYAQKSIIADRAVSS